MTKYVATIQAGHKAERIMPLLAEGLQKIAAESFNENAEKTVVKWKIIPKNFAWTAGRPSNSSVLMCTVPKGISVETRTNFMAQVNEFWIDHTEANPNELLIFTLDSKS